MIEGLKVSKELDSLMQRGKSFLNCEYPLICGAMTWVSEPNLISAVVKAGGFASIAAGNSPLDLLQKQIETVSATGKKNFAVNLITIAPSYQSHLKLVTEMKMPYIIFAGSLPKEKEVQMAKESGAKVLCFASTMALAKRMIKFGADALIMEGSEAGGHIGHVSTMVLLQEILFNFGDQVPVFTAGGIGTGRMFAHMLLMGAAGVQMGTRFVMTEECLAHKNFKDSFARSEARDAIATSQFDTKLPVVSVRALKNEGVDEFNKLQLKLIKDIDAGLTTREVAQHDLETFWIGSLRKAVVDGNVQSGSLMAGQSVGLVKNVVPVKEMVRDIITEADKELIAVKQKLSC